MFLLDFPLTPYEEPLWLEELELPPLWLEEDLEPPCPLGGLGRVLEGGLFTPPFLTTPSLIGRLEESWFFDLVIIIS